MLLKSTDTCIRIWVIAQSYSEDGDRASIQNVGIFSTLTWLIAQEIFIMSQHFLISAHTLSPSSRHAQIPLLVSIITKVH
jgi:hypothetical protein